MLHKSIAAVTAGLLIAALGPLSAAVAAPPTPQYTDVYSHLTDLYMYDSQVSGAQEWAMQFKATDSGMPNTVTVVTNNVTPQNVRIFSGDYLGGAGTLVATKTGTATTVTDPTQLRGTDYTYALQPATATSVMLKDTWYTLVLNVPFNTPVGLATPFNDPNTRDLHVGQAGAFTWTYIDVDNRLAGSVNVQLDTTAPTGSVDYTAAPTGDNGWYTVFPTAHFVCSDVGFGVATCPQDITAAADGNFTPQGTVTDLVGLSALIVGATVKVDTTPPGVIATYEGTAGDNGWYTSWANLLAECSDATSLVASCVGDTVTADGLFTLHALAKDNAGNTTGKSVDVKVDTVAPELTATYQGTLGANGWYTTQSDLKADCLDETSGIATCIGDTAAADGNLTLHATAKDKAGNTASKDVDVKVDATAPGLTATYQGVAGTNGWFTTQAALSAECTDATSGVDTCTGDNVTTDGTFTLHASATDKAGNTTTKDVEVKVDSVAPTASVTGVTNGQVLTVGNTSALKCTSADVTSGIAGCTLQATPALTTVGRHSVVAVAVDNAGNQTTSAPVVVYTAPLITWGPANNKPLKAGTYVTFTYTLRTSAGKLIDAKVGYLQPLPRTNTHAANISKYAVRVSTGQYKMRVYVTPSMAKTKYWKFGVTVGGRTLSRVYVVQ